MAVVLGGGSGDVLARVGRYDPTQHVVWDGPNAWLLDELDLTDYLATRFGVVGTPEECRSQVDAMASAGVDRIIAPAVDRDPDGLLARFASAVIPGR